MAEKTVMERHLILREAYRHLSEFATLVQESIPDPSVGTMGGLDRPINGQSGDLRHIIEYKGVVLSYFDLLVALREADLTPRKKQAFWLNVILDMKQRDVADIMKISPVSVGQYVQSAAKTIEEVYFKDEEGRD